MTSKHDILKHLKIELLSIVTIFNQFGLLTLNLHIKSVNLVFKSVNINVLKVQNWAMNVWILVFPNYKMGSQSVDFDFDSEIVNFNSKVSILNYNSVYLNFNTLNLYFDVNISNLNINVQYVIYICGYISLIYGWVQANDGLSWCVSGNANKEKTNLLTWRDNSRYAYNEFEYGVKILNVRNCVNNYVKFDFF